MQPKTTRRLALRLLRGANGDLHLDFDGGFRHVPHDSLNALPDAIRENRLNRTPALVQIANQPDYRLILTPAGADFMLENLGPFTARDRFLLKAKAAQRETPPKSALPDDFLGARTVREWLALKRLPIEEGHPVNDFQLCPEEQDA